MTSRRSRRRVHVVDYGMGNLTSVRHALEYLGAEVDVSSRPADLDRVGHAILPGVGSFRAAMHNLRETGWVDAIRRYAADGERQLLGICLGMQLLGASSPEDGTTAGLGLVDGIVERLDRKSTRLNSSHVSESRMPSSA